jgi:hypothetical protein
MRLSAVGAIAALVCALTAVLATATAGETALRAELFPVEDGISAKGEVVVEPAKEEGEPMGAVARVGVSPSSFDKLGLDPKRLDLAKVQIQSSTMPFPVSMKLQPPPKGEPQSAIWFLEVAGKNAFKLQAGDKVVVFIQGNLTLRGIAE